MSTNDRGLLRLLGRDAANRKWHSLACRADVSTRPTASLARLIAGCDSLFPLSNFPYAMEVLYSRPR